MPGAKDIGFKKHDFVVYPTHGVGKVLGIDTQVISGHSLQVITILFDKDRMFSAALRHATVNWSVRSCGRTSCSSWTSREG